VVRQHAHTARLLGVDFVPAYRQPGTLEDAFHDAPQPEDATARPVEVEPIVERAPDGPTHAQPTSQPAARVLAEPKPARAQPAAPAPSMLLDTQTAEATGGYSAGAIVRLPNWCPPPKTASEDERAWKLRAMQALRARYEADAPHQHFVTDHHTIVWSDGDVMSRVVFVGEAPGEEEDKSGVPFVGRAGQLLSKMITAMGLSRDPDASEKGGSGVYICNVLKTRPPNNATPTSREAGLCEPYLMEQLAIVRPAAIVTVGLPATRTLLKTDDAMSRLRGRWQPLTMPAGSGGPALTIPVMPTYHPAFLLRSYTEENRRKVWQDLQLVMQRLASS
jgi:DNA polymerase